MQANANPFDFIFNELSKILNFIEKNKIDPKADPLPPDILDRMTLLKQKINLLTTLNEKSLQEAGVTQNTIEKNLGDPDQLTPVARRLITRIQKLKYQAEMQHKEIEKQVRIAKAREKQHGKSLDQKEMAKRRKKKFKAVGGSNWLPL